MSRRSSPDITALRIAAQGICRQLQAQAREQARRIRSGVAGDLTEADVERMTGDMVAAARAQLDDAAPPIESLAADPELTATRKEAAQLMAATARQADAELRNAWRARQDKVAGRRRRR